MRILILWADESSPNLGVRALGSGTAALVRRVWPEAEIVFQNYGHRARELPFGALRSLARERVTGALGMQRWLGGFDLVVDTRSGDSFTDAYGLHRLATMSAVAEFATQAGTPVVLGPQTVGPFRTARGRALARRSLGRAHLTMVRDEASAQQCRELGHPAQVHTTDVVFALPPVVASRARDVVFGVSGLLWNSNPHVDSARYREVITALYRRLVDSGRSVSLLAHVLDSPTSDNDVPAVREFAASVAGVGPAPELLVPTDLADVRAMVAPADLVIASRMHACLNALSVGTPAIPLAYSRKFEPLLHGLGWNHTVDLTAKPETAAAVDAVLAGAAGASGAGAGGGSGALRAEAAQVVARAQASLLVAEQALRGIA